MSSFSDLEYCPGARNRHIDGLRLAEMVLVKAAAGVMQMLILPFALVLGYQPLKCTSCSKS